MPTFMFILGIVAGLLNLFVAVVALTQKHYVRAVWHALVLALLVAVMMNKL